MAEFNLLLVVASLLVLVLGLTENVTRGRLALSEPMIAAVAGVLIGPSALAVVTLMGLGDEHVLLEQMARFTVALAVVGVALRLPHGFFTGRSARGLLMALGPVMLGMWLVSSLCAWLALGVDVPTAALLGAILTPTDPVLASSIVTGRHAEAALPERLRHLLSAESGANDGLAYLLVFLPILALTHPPGEVAVRWLSDVLLIGVIAAVAAGGAIGWCAGRLLQRSRRAGTASRTSLLTTGIALSFFTVGAVKLLDSDGILAAFAAGTMLRRVIAESMHEETRQFQESTKRLFELPMFFIFGLAAPLGEWHALGWPLLVFVIAVLALRRLPAVLACAGGIPQLQQFRDTLLVGWFGPIGIAALYYAEVSLRHGASASIWAAASAVIAASIVAHGITATPGARMYASKTREEHAGASAHAWAATRVLAGKRPARAVPRR